MKILHVITTLRTGGAERLLVDLCPRLAKSGHQIDVLSFCAEETPFLHKLKASGINVLSSGYSGYYNPCQILGLPALMEQYDVIHTHNTTPQFFVALSHRFCKKKPLLVTTEHSMWNRRRNMPLFRSIDRWMYGKYSLIVGVSGMATNALVDFIGNGFPIVTIFNGINLNRITPIAADRNLEKGPVVMTMVAGFRDAKDQDTVVRALVHLPERFRIRFVGTGKRLETVRELALKLGVEGRVDFLGLRTDVADILHSSDIGIISSHYEGCSLASIEAMAAGLPIIASDVEGLKQSLGYAGIYFPEGDDVALADSVRNLISDKEEYLRRRDLSIRRSKEFDIDTTAEKYLTAYYKLLNH